MTGQEKTGAAKRKTNTEDKIWLTLEYAGPVAAIFLAILVNHLMTGIIL